MTALTTSKPSWDKLFGTAATQDGHFTTQQAADAGYSTQALYKHIRAGRAIRVRRGIYRLTHYPHGDHEDLVVAWLWFEQRAVFSHQTALALHELSDALPSRNHLTLPSGWAARRFRLPPHTTLHYGDVPSGERTWFGAVPVTKVGRTLRDCAECGVSPELLEQATEQAAARGLLSKRELRQMERALAAFDGATR